MGISIEGIVAILGAIGGAEAIKGAIRTWKNRKTDARKEDASADSMEIQNLLNIIDNQSSQIDTLYARLKTRDEKVDFMYAELRTAEEKIMQLVKEKHEIELNLKVSELKRCDILGCKERIPPRDY